MKKTGPVWLFRVFFGDEGKNPRDIGINSSKPSFFDPLLNNQDFMVQVSGRFLSATPPPKLNSEFTPEILQLIVQRKGMERRLRLPSIIFEGQFVSFQGSNGMVFSKANPDMLNAMDLKELLFEVLG